MHHLTTPDTARRLKEAGFPQPEPELYQVWYGLIGDTEKINILIEYSRKRYRDLFGNSFRSQSFLTCGTYAPTATEITESIASAAVELSFNPLLKVWFCALIDNEVSFHHQNPAEAAAQMWLHLREKEEGK